MHNKISPVFSSHCPQNASQVDARPGSSVHNPHKAHATLRTFTKRQAQSISNSFPRCRVAQLENQCMCVLMLGPGDLSPNNKYLCIRMLEPPQHTKPRREPVLAGLRSNCKNGGLKLFFKEFKSETSIDRVKSSYSGESRNGERAGNSPFPPFLSFPWQQPPVRLCGTLRGVPGLQTVGPRDLCFNFDLPFGGDKLVILREVLVCMNWGDRGMDLPPSVGCFGPGESCLDQAQDSLWIKSREVSFGP